MDLERCTVVKWEQRDFHLKDLGHSRGKTPANSQLERYGSGGNSNDEEEKSE